MSDEVKTWTVSVPFTGIIVVNVEANDRGEATQKALLDDQLTLKNCEEWEAVEEIVRGNVFYGVQNKIDAEEE